MRVLRWFANRMNRTGFGRRAVADRADLSIFRDRPAARLKLGLLLLALSYVIGWPAVGTLGIAAAYLHEPLVVIIGGPTAYALSWVVFWISMALTGHESIRCAHALERWMVRRLIEKHSDRIQRPSSESVGSTISASSSSRDIE